MQSKLPQPVIKINMQLRQISKPDFIRSRSRLRSSLIVAKILHPVQISTRIQTSKLTHEHVNEHMLITDSSSNGFNGLGTHI